MITSITLKKADDTVIASISEGVVTFVPEDDNIGITYVYSEVVLSCDYNASDCVSDVYYNSLETSGVPYITSISDVPPNAFGTVWMVGGDTAQVDDTSSGVSLCDMAQTVPVSQTYQAVYDMLNQIRLWLDGAKDNLILDEPAAATVWDRMLEEYSDSSTSDTVPGFNETRPRCCIPAISPALSLLNEYKATVFLWNFKASKQYAAMESTVHPADECGLTISYAMQVNTCKSKTSSIAFSIQMNGQVGTKKWLRVTRKKSFPEGATMTDNINGSTGVMVESDTMSFVVDITTPATSASVYYDVAVIAEVFPYYDCSSSSDYYKSRSNDNYVDGSNSWTITATASYINEFSDSVSNTIVVNKYTPYTPECSSSA